ncbi:MAG: bifunctional DNA-formamidopyrimidine glycosylase/DNA-(apurinic or apyrimidinic site) lyase [Desulfitobacteriaceae bacterium]
MPELPEVETIRRTLAQHVSGSKITSIQVIWPGALKGWEDQEFVASVTGKKMERFDRRGKYLLIELEQGWSLIAHMRMTGRLLYYPQAHEPERHTHVVFGLDHGELHFADLRKFGRIQVVPTSERWKVPSLAILGPEPLSLEFTPEVLMERLKRKKSNLKTVLLNQSVLAGLGNIYTDESLFRAFLAPERLADSLSLAEVVLLHRAIQEVLREGIAAQGTSFRDYRDANGAKGTFQNSLQVYGRSGEACLLCGMLLTKKRLGGRTTVFCPRCQH